MKIYGLGGWDWRSLAGSILLQSQRKVHTFSNVLFGGLWQVKELPVSELVPLYQRCKIGINLHMSFGPSNVRTYQLPSNGVMQICDCLEGLSQVFEIGREVVAYRSVKEAIERIRYYLEHDDERKRIAAASFRRTMRDYKRLTTFSKAMTDIKKGMLEDGIRHFKSGKPVNIT